MSRSSQRGITMVELAVIIVILGLLAAFALPRYIGLERQARIAAVDGMAGSVRSAANMAHGLWLAQGNPGNITVNGTSITIAFGYPDAAGLARLVNDTSGFDITVAAAKATFTPEGAAMPAGCSVVYTEATSATTPFAVTTPAPATMNRAC